MSKRLLTRRESDQISNVLRPVRPDLIPALERATEDDPVLRTDDSGVVHLEELRDFDDVPTREIPAETMAHVIGLARTVSGDL